MGGSHLLTLARLGIGQFHIADFDRYELKNFNRQVGATMSSLGQEKAAVMAERALDINPDLRLRTFGDGVHAGNIDEFLDGVDLYVDGLDVFVLQTRREVFRRCAERGIPAITAGPIGMGVVYLLFTPESMSFEKYFFDGSANDGLEELVDFLVGITARSRHDKYLVDASQLDLEGKRAPSTVIGCQLAAAVTGAEAVKVLLGRGQLKGAPYLHQFDAYQGRWSSKKLHGGARDLVQGLKRRIGYKRARKLGGPRIEIAATTGMSEMERILDLSRWAPSGDNNQPWRFRIQGDDRIEVELRVPQDDVYDLSGEGTILSGGFLLETMRLAASRFGRSLHWSNRREGDNILIDAQLPRNAAVSENDLLSYVPVRSVDRRRYHTTRLDAAQKQMLVAALGDELELKWFESLGDRWRVSRVNAMTTDIRLRIPETLAVHQRIVDFEHKLSPTGVAAEAIGLDPMLRRAMRWSFQSPRRNALVTSLSGTLVPRMELDVLPGLSCGAHFVVALRSDMAHAAGDVQRDQALLRAGASLQRTWLTATRLGLAMQPSFGPIAFGKYGKQGVEFTENRRMLKKSVVLADRVQGLWPHKDLDTMVFAGRIGTPLNRAHSSRSVRRPLEELLLPSTRSATVQTESGLLVARQPSAAA